MVVVPAIAPSEVIVVVVGVPAAIKTVARVPVEIVVAIKIVEGIISVRIICGESAGRALDALKGNIKNASVMASGTGSTEITATIEFILDAVGQVCQVLALFLVVVLHAEDDECAVFKHPPNVGHGAVGKHRNKLTGRGAHLNIIATEITLIHSSSALCSIVDGHFFKIGGIELLINRAQIVPDGSERRYFFLGHNFLLVVERAA